MPTLTSDLQDRFAVKHARQTGRIADNALRTTIR